MIHYHFKIYKPAGFVSQFICVKKRKKRLLGELFDFPEGTMAIGRLDADSEGLLLMTTDGKISELIRSEKFEKEYWVQLDGVITSEALHNLSTGVEIGFDGKKYVTLPCEVSVINPPDLPEGKRIRSERHGPTSWITITLKEGKNRQVRKMTAAVGFPTLRLIRVRIGSHTLGQMQPGVVVPVVL